MQRSRGGTISARRLAAPTDGDLTNKLNEAQRKLRVLTADSERYKADAARFMGERDAAQRRIAGLEIQRDQALAELTEAKTARELDKAHLDREQAPALPDDGRVTHVPTAWVPDAERGATEGALNALTEAALTDPDAAKVLSDFTGNPAHASVDKLNELLGRAYDRSKNQRETIERLRAELDTAIATRDKRIADLERDRDELRATLREQAERDLEAMPPPHGDVKPTAPPSTWQPFQKEIEARDKRIAELESQLAEAKNEANLRNPRTGGGCTGGTSNRRTTATARSPP